MMGVRRVKLWTRLPNGNPAFLHDPEIPAFRVPPGVVVWRGRFFVLEACSDDTYFEAHGYLITESPA